MYLYKNQALAIKALIVILLTTLSQFLLYTLHSTTEGGLLEVVTFIVLLLNLYAVFNLKEIKLYYRIFLGMALGAIAGSVWGETIVVFKPMGSVFIQMIKMIVIPLVFASLLVGTASMNDLKKLGRIGTKTIIFYLLSTALAISIGLGIANFVKPGSSIPVETKTQLQQNYKQEADEKIASSLEKPSTVDLLIDIIPDNPARSMADGKMLQIIFFAIVSGIAIVHISAGSREVVLNFFEGVNEICIKLVHMIMGLAPYGVFALIAAVIGTYGSEILITLFSYFATTIAALLVHVVLFNSVVIRLFTNTGLKQFWSGIAQAVIVAFSTSSSSATLPVTIECAEKNLNVKPQVASFILPLGSTINMDGTAIFQGVSAVFIATIYGMDLTFADQLTIILTATLASIGAAGAPQVGIIMLTLVLQSIGIPLEGIALIIGVERFLDMVRTAVNVTSDLSCAAIINHQEM